MNHQNHFCKNQETRWGKDLENSDAQLQKKIVGSECENFNIMKFSKEVAIILEVKNAKNVEIWSLKETWEWKNQREEFFKKTKGEMRLG